MRGVKMKTNGPTTKGLAELNHHVRDEHKEVRDGVGGEGQGLSEEDESRINEDSEYVNCGGPHPVLPRAQTQPQVSEGQVIQWERILPLRSLKVLLVENDDSTRHVVTALLRNCCYEVTAVQNGLEAWQILEDSINRIDLVLTEVVMPCLSGIRLLCNIMSHKTCKNIPVIMMSSNDSMGIVFKCLSKGAVDFLVKPIRKNELKNLWQHVWRKCHSSSGSGSESSACTRKPTTLISDEGSDNNIGSKDEDDNGNVGFGVRDGSDNGSGTQSSWTKRAVEGDSPKQTSPREQLEDPPYSTCAQVICSKPEAFSYNWVPTNATKEYQEQNNELDNLAMGKDLEIGVPRNPDLQLEAPTEKVLTSAAASNEDKFTDLDLKRDAEKLEKGNMGLRSETPNRELRDKATNHMGFITKSANPQMESAATDIPNDISKTTKGISFLELSLKRLNEVGDTGTSLQEQNVLRHSDLSAFSRYTTTLYANQAPTGNIGSCSPLDDSSEASKREPAPNLQSNSNGTPTQPSNESSNNDDMGSTTNNVFNNLHSSPLQERQNGHMSSLQPVVPVKTGAEKVKTALPQASGMNQQVQVQHHHHHYHHHHHHHVHNTKQKGQPPNHDDVSVINTVASPHCGPSNVLRTPVESNAANYYSLNGSTSGSNNGQNGDSSAVNFGGTNMASDNGTITGKCGAGAGAGAGGESGSGSGSGVDQNRFAHREAALNKFRQKRKDRCFEKKVRYQSRKKLAEQRPRVRGQFVRQVIHENKSKDTNC